MLIRPAEMGTDMQSRSRPLIPSPGSPKSLSPPHPSLSTPGDTVCIFIKLVCGTLRELDVKGKLWEHLFAGIKGNISL